MARKAWRDGWLFKKKSWLGEDWRKKVKEIATGLFTLVAVGALVGACIGGIRFVHLALPGPAYEVSFETPYYERMSLTVYSRDGGPARIDVRFEDGSSTVASGSKTVSIEPGQTVTFIVETPIHEGMGRPDPITGFMEYEAFYESIETLINDETIRSRPTREWSFKARLSLEEADSRRPPPLP